MKALRFLLIPLLGCSILAGGLSLHAQGRTYSPDQVNQMVAPIALYPDALMSQVLMASTYPNQVVETDQWVRANPGLSGSALDNALATATWDPSVISLSKFPTVLDRMAQNITWTTDLGNAFLYQRTDVMNAVQDLRSAAYQNGTLRTNEQERVVVEGQDIVIQPATPEVIYVPVYQPTVVYGSYWNYPSYYYPGVWDPWPGYSFINGFAWGFGFLFGNVLFGGCDWGHHDVWMDYGAINNCSLYHNTPYYNSGYGGGYTGQQPWVRQRESVNYANGETGAPYGGRSRGTINGVTAGQASRIEPATISANRGDAGSAGNRTTQRGSTNYGARNGGPVALDGSTNNTARADNRTTQRNQMANTTRDNARATQRDAMGDTARNTNRTTQRGSTDYGARNGGRVTMSGTTNNPARGAGRMTMDDPTRYTTRGANRPNSNGVPNYSLRGTNRSTVNGPANNAIRGANRPTVNSVPNYSARGGNRPSVNAPSSYSTRGANRPTANNVPNYSARGANRPAMSNSTNTSARGYNRPAVTGSANYSARAANRSAIQPQTGYSRSGNSQSYARSFAPSTRAAAPSARINAPSGHSGGGRQASAAPRGGQRVQTHR